MLITLKNTRLPMMILKLQITILLIHYLLLAVILPLLHMHSFRPDQLIRHCARRLPHNLLFSRSDNTIKTSRIRASWIHPTRFPLFRN
uniref:Uncharacterized protein n=1 Tax=Strigamia maritima TaxID=126957 RepID=T1IHV7_STRMM